LAVGGIASGRMRRACAHIKPAVRRTVTSLVASLDADSDVSYIISNSSSSSMASLRPGSSQSRHAWGSTDHGGSANPAMDDDDLMPAAMESELCAPTKPRSIAPPPPPQPTGCWGTFTRGLRCKSASTSTSLRRGGYVFIGVRQFVFVRLSGGLRKKNTQPIFTKFADKVSRGPWKKLLDSADWWTSAI